MIRNINFNIIDNSYIIEVAETSKLISINKDDKILKGQELYDKIFSDYKIGDEIKINNNITEKMKKEDPAAEGLFNKILELINDIARDINNTAKEELESADK